MAVALAAGAARAQDTTQAAPPQTHVVEAGETLWTLAQRYLGDPMLWPAIYRLNTLVVEDPHWIFPGEELRLAPPDTTVVVPGQPVVGAAPAPADTTAVAVGGRPPAAVGRPDTTQAVTRPEVAAAELPPPPPPPNEGAPTVFTRRRGQEVMISGRAGSVAYHAVLPGSFYAAGFLTEQDKLPWATVIGASGKATIGSLTSVTTARIFELVEIRTPEGASYQVGDSVLLAEVGREIPNWGRVVIPTAIAQVRETAGRQVVAEILQQFGRVNSDQVAMPLEPFRNPGTAVPVPIENGMKGSLIAVRDLHPLPGQEDVVFIDRGREDGVTPGDLFEVLRPNPLGTSPETPLQQVAVLQVVHVRQHSATGMLRQVSGLGVSPGAPVRLIRKMPS